MKRGFLDTSFGQVHYRTAAPAAGGRPLVLIHGSPSSARSLEPLANRFAAERPVFALDTLGNGDSAAAPADADMALFARAHREAIDALGLNSFDLYGTHTGANLACEIAIAWPGRVGRLILDGMSLFPEDQRADFLTHYAPPLEISSDGRHLLWLWQFLRDGYIFWPWYRHGAENLRGVGVPGPDALHDRFVEVVKAARTYRVSYNAAFAYPTAERLPLVRTPTLVACAQSDMLLVYQDEVVRLMPNARKLVSAERLADADAHTFDQLVAFLDAAPAVAAEPVPA
jgi:pimeloyl-ACP methyl ester carboxylesterase